MRIRWKFGVGIRTRKVFICLDKEGSSRERERERTSFCSVTARELCDVTRLCKGDWIFLPTSLFWEHWFPQGCRNLIGSGYIDYPGGTLSCQECVVAWGGLEPTCGEDREPESQVCGVRCFVESLRFCSFVVVFLLFWNNGECFCCSVLVVYRERLFIYLHVFVVDNNG